MKRLLPIFLAFPCICGANQPEVSVQLASARTEYRTHDDSSAAGFGLKFELTPAPGISFCETEDLSSELIVTDSIGTKHKAVTARLTTTENGQTFAIFTTKKRPTGSKFTIEGTLNLNIAIGLTKHAPVKIDLLQPNDIRLGNSTLKIIPVSANATPANRENDRLRRAEITIEYSSDINIIQIARQWLPDVMPEPNFSQNVEFDTSVSADGATKSTTLILVDVLTSPHLQFSTCAEQKFLQIPLNFSVGLSDAVKISEESPNSTSTPAEQP